MKELSLAEIELGRAKALENARALIEDAEILFAEGRYPHGPLHWLILPAKSLGR